MTGAGAAVGIVGLGEVGTRLARELQEGGHALLALDTRPHRPRVEGVAEAMGIPLVSDPRSFGSQVRSVMVTATGGRCTAIARELTPHLQGGTVYADWTSKAPLQRDEVHQLCRSHSLPFTDVAILGTVSWPDRAVPLLLSGDGGDRTAGQLAGTSFACQVLEGPPRSAEVKLLRSAFTKGLTALLAETLTASERAGIRSLVEESISGFLDSGATRIIPMLLGSSIPHARRRAEEAAEVSQMMGRILEDPVMSRATATYLDRVRRHVEALDDATTATSTDEAIAVLVAMGVEP